MTVAEKIGQMTQLNASGPDPVENLGERLRSGRLGSILNLADVEVVNELQRIAVEESRLGIPLLVGRDVIHGFATVMPLPIGQAASFNPDIARDGARIAALEAASAGVNWTFAPMIDISRDPRWGRIAESYGEDPYLTSVMGAATIEGFQGDDLAAEGTIAACAKHFAGYGAAEAGRDYAATYIPENELRNVYLTPFKAAADAGVATFMTSFSDLNGVPATGNDFLLRQVLRDEWGYDGFVVSDWDSIRQLQVHGLTENDRESAYAAVTAGVDMEMQGDAYINHLEPLLNDGMIDIAGIDVAAGNILRLKFELGLFENPYTDPRELPAIASEEALATAKRAALRETVFLLRGLPDVEPPDDFGQAVMSRIASGEATAPIVLRAFRSLAQPRFAAPLAAGLIGLALSGGGLDRSVLLEARLDFRELFKHGTFPTSGRLATRSRSQDERETARRHRDTPPGKQPRTGRYARGVYFSYFLRNRSTRPAVSTIFCVPV